MATTVTGTPTSEARTALAAARETHGPANTVHTLHALDNALTNLATKTEAADQYFELLRVGERVSDAARDKRSGPQLDDVLADVERILNDVDGPDHE